MNTAFSFKSSIKTIQNNLISQNIRDVSNSDILRSEEAITTVIASYIDRFKTLGGLLFDAGNYLAQSKAIIKVNDFNDIFQSVYIDLASLYGDLDAVDNVLSLNLQRNKKLVHPSKG